MALPTVVVGSGPSAVHLASSLLESGRDVLMIDAGGTVESWDSQFNLKWDWEELRKKDSQTQTRIFWGEDWGGLPVGPLRAGAGLTPSRRAVVEGVEEFLPVVSSNFHPVESLAVGGLGGAWGLGAFAMSDAQLKKMGLSPSVMRQGYQRTAERIGIAGTNPEAADVFTAGVSGLLPELQIDAGAQKMWERAQAQREKLRSSGVVVGKTPLALLSRDFSDRHATRYGDLDFYADIGRSAYRPQWTLEELERHPRFQRISQVLVTEVEETADLVRVHGISRSTGEQVMQDAMDVALCAGAIGSARILLRSAATYQKRQLHASLLCSPYSYLMGLRWRDLGQVVQGKRHSLGQLVIGIGKNEQDMGELAALGSVLSYRSLLLTRLIAQSPLPPRESRPIFQFLQSSLQVVGAFFPDDASEGTREMKWVDGKLEIQFDWGPRQKTEHAHHLKRLKRVLTQLGAPVVAQRDPGPGGSIHYAGTVPFSNHPLDGFLSSDPQTAVVHGWKRVRVGDGSPFTACPAAGITWSLMAFADQLGLALGRGRALW